jgi:hypothetical protein
MFNGQKIRLALVSLSSMLALGLLGCNDAKFSGRSFGLTEGGEAPVVSDDDVSGSEDDEAGEEAKVVADLPILWPPNHKMVLVSLAPSVEGDSCSVKSVSSSEADAGLDIEDVAADFEIVGDLQVNLRSERFGEGEGRIYEISLECKNAAEEIYSEIVQVQVPHDMGK